MARSLDQISTDLEKLESATQAIDTNLQAIYQEYLTALGQAVKQQLVLAAYHLCTQAYPEEFLTLAVAQREKLQANLRHIALKGRSQVEQLGQATDLSGLASRLEAAVAAKYGEIEPEPAEADQAPVDDQSFTSEDAADSGIETAIADSVVSQIHEPSEPSADETEDSSSSADAAARLAESDQTDSDQTESEFETKMAAASEEASTMLKRLSASLSLFSILSAEPLTPVSLAKRHVLLERHLRAILRTLSALANHSLKQANILPDLPEIVIAAAAESEGSESGPGKPNLLNVMVELSERPEDVSEDDELDDEEEEDDEEMFSEADDGDREMTHLVAINLRLADIEFADHQTALWRGRLQETLYKLKKLGSRYQKLQQEKARAEAEHAWRAIWFEE